MPKGKGNGKSQKKAATAHLRAAAALLLWEGQNDVSARYFMSTFSFSLT